MDGHADSRRKKVVDAITGAIPNPVVRWAAARGAPMARMSGYTSMGSAALAQALATLAQPPVRLWSRDKSGTLEEIASRLDRSPEEVARWHAAGMLTQGATGAGAELDRDAFDRATLIDLALRSGAQEAALTDAAAGGNLVWAAIESVLTAGGSMTGAEVADRAGVPAEMLADVWRSLGLPTGRLQDAAFSRRDVHAVRTLGALSSVFSDEDLQEASAVIGRAMAEVSSVMVELVRRRIAEPLLEAGGTDTDVVVRLAAIRDLLVPTLAPLLEITLERHLDSTIRSDISVRMEELLEPGTQHRVLSVGFADLVGFTSVSEGLSPTEVRNLAAGLHRAADGAVRGHGGKIVKSIGDAVMFTAASPVRATLAALELVDAVTADPELPPVRVGIAHGPVLPGYADYFGRTVNLASRLCAVAEAGEVLLHGEIQGLEAEGLAAQPRPVGELKGIDGAVEACVVRRD